MVISAPVGAAASSPTRRAAAHFLRPARPTAPAGSAAARGVVERVFHHRRADLVGRHGDDLVDELAAQPERLLADLAHGDAVGEQADLRKRDALAAAIAAAIEAASSGSTPTIRISGRRYFVKDAMPAASPPPPMGMKIASIGSGCWRRISMPIVPWPAITAGSS